ncbi:UDP-glucose 4-epimerase family protein [Marinicellulosiphila megalodicopiae]|uniref:UDP-glucose 4-epimerase family protein n=1 Tax=Marinicellulosiphila megalodicopiae TaxID=2724896 RepID=UPI003BB183FB
MIGLTGATGFLGTSLLKNLDGKFIKAFGRSIPTTLDDGDFYGGSINKETNFSHFLKGINVCIHCAARTHVMHDKSLNPLEDFREVNTCGTLNLANQAAKAGVKRFIFISSIKVNGESTELHHPFCSSDTYIPRDPYGLSKYEAEVGLKKISKETGMEVVIIRPPLVYGPGVKANFFSMMNLMSKGLPLPLGGITKNQRSLVYIENLVDLIITCIDHPKAANKTFLVSDDHDVSTTELLSTIASKLKVPNRLIPLPSSWLNFMAKLVGKSDVAQRLCGSLQVDIEETKSTLDWKPPFTFDEGIQLTAKAYLNKNLK